jgi:hypothetical protein
MKVEEIREIARQRGLKVGKMKKAEMIRIIQQSEGNEECFASGKASMCGQGNCLWLHDCD